MMLKKGSQVFAAIGWAAAHLSVSASCLANPAETSGAAQSVDSIERAASNQSVSLTGSNPPSPQVPDDGLAASDYAASDGLDARQSTFRLRRSNGSPASAGNASPLEAARLQGDQAVPWYRSGVGALAIVLGLVGATAWALRRCIPSARIGSSRVMRVVSRAPLTQKHSLALVYLGRRFLVVGVSGERVNTLCEIHDPDEVAELVNRIGVSDTKTTSPFENALLRENAAFDDAMESRETSSTSDSLPVQAGREPLRDLLRKLRTLKSTQ